jgi:hypothetical protein
MKSVISILFCAAIALSLSGFGGVANAEVLTYEKCALNSGKTLDDVEAVFREWRQVSEKAGFGDYKIRLLLPHAFADVGAGSFWIEGSAPNLERYGLGWAWWYSAPEAQPVAEALEKTFTCESRSIFRSAASM